MPSLEDYETQPLRHSRYFLPSVFFQVENTIFQVPKHLFDKNELFSTMFSLPTTSSADGGEGTSEERPVHLQGISEKAFVAFLDVLYPLNLSGKPEITVREDWISALMISDMWGFTSVRHLAIVELSKEEHKPSSPIDMMTLGEKFNVPHWFVKGCTSLIKREEALTLEDVNAIGLKTSLVIHKLREMHLKKSGQPAIMSEIQNSFGSLAHCDDNQYSSNGWASNPFNKELVNIPVYTGSSKKRRR